MSVTSSNKKLHLLPAFKNNVGDSQWVYRKLLKAMSEPGTILRLFENNNTSSLYIDEFTSPYLYSTTWSIAQSLLDGDCTTHLSKSLAQVGFMQSLRFYTDAHISQTTPPAQFAFMNINEFSTDDSFDRLFSTGTLIAPHESCTLIIQVPHISIKPQLYVTGPGIKTQKQFSIEGISQQAIEFIQANNQLYPCGVDMVFCSATHIVALPRTTALSSSTTISEVA